MLGGKEQGVGLAPSPLIDYAVLLVRWHRSIGIGGRLSVSVPRRGWLAIAVASLLLPRREQGAGEAVLPIPVHRAGIVPV